MGQCPACNGAYNNYIVSTYLPTYLPTYISTYPRVVIYERKLLLRLATDVFAYRTSHR